VRTVANGAIAGGDERDGDLGARKRTALALPAFKSVENDAWRRGSGPTDLLQRVGMSSQYFVDIAMEHETHPQEPAPRGTCITDALEELL